MLTYAKRNKRSGRRCAESSAILRKQLPGKLTDQALHLKAQERDRDRRGRQAALADDFVDGSFLVAE